MSKYLLNGEEINLIREVDGGYLYNPVYKGDCEYDNYEYIDEDVILFTEKIYDNPPTKKMHEKIDKLKKDIDSFEQERIKTKKLAMQEKSLLANIKEKDFIQLLVDYLNKDFEYVLDLTKMGIKRREQVYISPYIKIVNKEDTGFGLYKLKNKNYDSYEDYPIMVFKTFEDAQIFAKKELIKRLKHWTEKANYKWNSRSIVNWFNNISNSIKLKEDKELLKIYNSKLTEAKQKEDEEKRKKIQEEIDEKSKELENLKTETT